MLKTAQFKRINLLEHTSTAGRVDRTAGVIRGVKILGATSKNNREYTPQALREAASLYEGCRVNFDHPSRDTPNASRSVRDWIGQLENVRVTGGAVYGDLHLIKSHPYAESVMEAAERFPRKFGLSHNASGDTRQSGTKMIVESVKSVRSVDLVQNPATNASLFESVDGNRFQPMSKRELLLKTASVQRQLLAERPAINARHLALRIGCRTFTEADGEMIADEANRAGLISKPVDKMNADELRQYIDLLSKLLAGMTSDGARPADSMSVQESFARRYR